MTSIRIPATVEEAVAELAGIEALLRAKGWERAAIVAAFVRLHDGPGGDQRSTMARSSHGLSTHEFAALGIKGLESKDTVRRYVQTWLDAHAGQYPQPGRTVKLPTTPWPPEDRSLGSRPTPSSIGRQMATNPKLATAAAAELARPGGAIEHVDADTVRDLSRTVDERRVRTSGATPNPSRITDRHKSDAERSDDEYWAKVRAALHTLLDARVRIGSGMTPPADIQILMQILVPETDWDAALRDEIGTRR